MFRPPVLAEYEDVLRRPRFKLQPHRIDTALQAIPKVGHLVEPVNTIAISTHEADNRFLECADAAAADYLVTGNTRHFPQAYKHYDSIRIAMQGVFKELGLAA